MRLDGIPNRFEVDPVVGMAKLVTHAADVVPWLGWHQQRSLVAESMSRVANPLEASFDRVPSPAILLKRSSLEPG